MLKPDLMSLLIGIAAGILIAVLIKSPNIRSFLNKNKPKKSKTARSDRNDEDQFRKNLLREVESTHLLSFFCRLSDLYVPQKLISNPLFIDPSVDSEEVPELFLNHLSVGEIPELSRDYPFPLLLLSEALSGGRNVLIKGRIGSGKTTVIANLIIEILEGRCAIAELNHFLPIYVHVRDIDLSGSDNSLEKSVINGLYRRDVSNKNFNFETIYRKYLAENRLLICIDGLDELLPERFDEVVPHIQNYLRQNPSVQIVVTSGPFYTGGLLKAGFIPFYLKPASLDDNRKLGQKISEMFLNDTVLLEKDIVRGWMKQISPTADLFTTTLQTFAFLSPVPNSRDSILEPYVQYVTSGRLSASNLGLIAEEFLINSVNNSPDYIRLEKVANLLKNNEKSSPGISAEITLRSLLEKRVLVSNPDGKIEFSNASVYCQLLAMSRNHTPAINPERLLRSPLEDRITQLSKQSNYLETWLNKTTQIQDSYLLLTLEHLIEKEDKKFISNPVIEKLARIVASSEKPLSMRYVAASIIFFAQPNILFYLLKHMSTSADLDTSQLIILLVGKTGDSKYSDLLAPYLTNEYVLLRDLAMLMLIKHPTLDQTSLIDFEMHGLGGNNVGLLMALAGDEGKRQLLEYSHSENPNCRRNAVTGLRMIDEAWCLNELHRLNSTDSAWMVRDAAAQAIENHWNPAIFVPRELPALEKNPLILQFVEENHITKPFSGSPAQLLTSLINSQEYLKQLLGLRYLLKLGGPQTDSWLVAMINRPDQLREVAVHILHEMNYANTSLRSKVL